MDEFLYIVLRDDDTDEIVGYLANYTEWRGNWHPDIEEHMCAGMRFHRRDEAIVTDLAYNRLRHSQYTYWSVESMETLVNGCGEVVEEDLED